MKSCTYKLGDQIFSSELALDEYLLNNKELFKEYGDEVFYRNTSQNAVANILKNSHKEKSRLYKLKKRAEVTGYSEDYYQVEKPYVGVNEFIRNYQRTTVGKEGRPLSPVFDIENYIYHKAKDWKEQTYWDNTASEDEVRDIFGEEEARPLTTKTELEAAQHRLEKKWQHQSYLGSAIHEAFSLWWHAPKKNKQSVEAFEAYLRDKLSGELGDSGKKYTELIPEKIWTQLAQHCFNLDKELNDKFPGATFLTEIGLVTDIYDENNKQIPLVGVADLIIIDKFGNAHVIDYKTSPKSYGDYNDAKKLSFKYQLAVYRRMMQRLGINLNEKSGAYIIPFKFENFRYNPDTDSSTFDNLYGENYDPTTGSEAFSYLQELDILIGSSAENMQNELDTFIPVNKTIDARAEDLLQELDDFTKECFASYYADQEITDEAVIEKIKKQNEFKKDETTGNYYFKIRNSTITDKEKVGLIAKVKKHYKENRGWSAEKTHGFKRAIEQAQQSGVFKLDYKGAMISKHSSEHWLEDKFGKYTKKNWQILSGPPILDELGIVLMQDKYSNQIDIIKLSGHRWQSLDDVVLLGGASYQDVKNNNRRLITGNFESDITQKQRPQSLALESNYGNIELMQTMAVLNMLPNLVSNNNGIIGEITVANLHEKQGMTAANKQLLYNFKELQNLRNVKRKEQNKEQVNNNFKNIKMSTTLDLIKNQFMSILHGEQESKFSKWQGFTDAKQDLDKVMANPIKLRAKLTDLIKKMEDNFELKKVEVNSYSEKDRPEQKLYYYLHLALAELAGVTYTQQTKDHAEFLESTKIWKEGLGGTAIDNPGNMSSDTLNYIAEQVNVAYQNVRNDMAKLSQQMREQVNKLKKAKNFGYLESRTVGNQANLYKNMYKIVEGDLRFKNPWDNKNDLSPEEREFLMFALKVINGNRDPHLITEEDFTSAILTKPEEFFAVPLTMGSFQSQVSSRGLLNVVKDRLAGLHWKKIQKTILEKVEGYLIESTDVKQARNGEEMWQMLNMFTATEGKDNVRQQVIMNILNENPELGMDYFERNLETLVLKHKFAYSQQKHMDSVFPVIKAGMLHLATQGTMMNTKFISDIKYLSDFIKNKIFNLSIEDSKMQPVNYYANILMGFASKVALVFNPRQLYQNLDGVWKDISLFLRKSDQDPSFTAQNLKDSFFWIYKDIMHFGDNKSMGELFNEQYGLNDMDINTLTSRLSSDNVGIYNFWNLGFRFASRPDYYNRITIFVSQMKGDGCFDAHSIENGKLVYDWTKDKRFDLFANTAESDVPSLSKEQQLKYKQQKAQYIAMAKQFVAEHAVDPKTDTEFIYEPNEKRALPRAYTTKQSEGLKALSDQIYGYYSHEKKILFQSTTFGALTMQMNTYWSSKKNQWLAPGGVKLQGRMEQYEENGKKYWYAMDSEGNITDEIVPDGDERASGIAYMQWKGQYEEGIILTLANIFTDWYQGDSETGKRDFLETLKKYYNHEDENLRRAYRCADCS